MNAGAPGGLWVGAGGLRLVIAVVGGFGGAQLIIYNDDLRYEPALWLRGGDALWP